jgi:hypothetical protein
MAGKVLILTLVLLLTIPGLGLLTNGASFLEPQERHATKPTQHELNMSRQQRVEQFYSAPVRTNEDVREVERIYIAADEECDGYLEEDFSCSEDEPEGESEALRTRVGI